MLTQQEQLKILTERGLWSQEREEDLIALRQKAQEIIEEKRINELKAQLKEVDIYEKENEEFRKKTEIIEQLKNNQVAPLRLLDQISEMLPKGVWLIHLTDKGGLISIEGYAHSNYDLVGYVQNLKGSKYISDVMLVESKRVEVDKISVYNFKLTLRIKV